MRIKGIRSVDKKDIKGTEYLHGEGSAKAFIDMSDDMLGYIWFTIEGKVMFINMIEMVDKEEGLGTEAVGYLFNELGIDKITGYVLNEDSLRSYYFWESLGAVFYGIEDGESVEDVLSMGIDIYFELFR